MATKAPKKTTRKTTARKASTTAAPTSDTSDQIATKQKSCAYPSCSARGTREFGDNNVPSCDHHAEIFETQAEDGAGIQQLMANYKG